MKKRTHSPSGGRPRKFAEPSRPITLTLPLRTLAQLARLGPDRAKAIVQAVDVALRHQRRATPDVELVPVGRGGHLIVCGNCPPLRKLEGVRMVEVGPDRFILSVSTGSSTAQVELALSDLMESLSPSERRKDRAIVEELLALFRRARRARHMTKEEILIVSKNIAGGDRAAPGQS